MRRYEFLTIEDFCRLYEISRTTLKKYLEDIKDQLPSYGKKRPFTDKEVKIIREYIEG